MLRNVSLIDWEQRSREPLESLPSFACRLFGGRGVIAHRSMIHPAPRVHF